MINLTISAITTASSTTGFDIGRWEHWLLVICFGVIAICGLWISFQWKQERLESQKKATTARQLMQIVHRLPSANQLYERKRFK